MLIATPVNPNMAISTARVPALTIAQNPSSSAPLRSCPVLVMTYNWGTGAGGHHLAMAPKDNLQSVWQAVRKNQGERAKAIQTERARLTANADAAR